MLLQETFPILGLCLGLTASAARVPEGSWYEQIFPGENGRGLLTITPRDSHIHIIDPDRFPLDPARGESGRYAYRDLHQCANTNLKVDYTPKPATVDNFTEFQESRGFKHAVIVLPSVYGTNNSILLDSLRHYGGRYRGVAVVDTENVTEDELDELHEAGVRGLRINLGSADDAGQVVDAARAHVAIARPRGWAVQVWAPLAAWAALRPVVEGSGVTFVADHLAHAEAGSRTGEAADTYDPYGRPGFREVVDLVRRRLLFVKISAPYRGSARAPLFEDLRVAAEALVAAGPDMVVYGSDWPHTASAENNGPGGPLASQDYRDINDAALLEIAKDWAGSEAQIRRLFVDNPRRLWQWYSED